VLIYKIFITIRLLTPQLEIAMGHGNAITCRMK
jgi:hypothetical protein